MKLRVTKSNLYRNGRRCAIGEVFEHKGDKVPSVYLGKVEVVKEDKITVATPDATSSNSGDEAQAKRRELLLEEIERMEGKRPGANTKDETLEAKFAELKLKEGGE
ncbi:hypothetical protein [Vreelandella venusta]|uniref:hypothetical protein n=1 Tax=Vreelandella venusta TaxID=44935 RepID=UPI003AA8066E